ncbi:AraC family transcriptional regulator [Mycobacterium yunnanensis]|uniref:AraC family transcriptional regulator n=1 Tax=Mycobacterium yunnanensis TaxID=368477 RepID=A0A9X2Z1V6_9MYCO|nr:AraC family transcriptional regulator [Mycobacterium yunnanensis]MCV7420602.1 AraC family transcriptional regulator [Mycobacterium yunnanensis]
MPLDEMRSLVDRHAGRTDIPDVIVSKATTSSPPTASMSHPILAIVAQGQKRVVSGDRVLDYGAGQYLVVSVDLPVVGQYVDASAIEPCLGFGLLLRPEEIAALMVQTGLARDGARERETPPGIAVSDAPGEMVDAAVRLLRLLDSPGDRDVLAPLIKREILWRLLTGDQSAMVRQIGLADSNTSAISAAMEWIRDHHVETLRIEEAARVARMSVSSFHRHFRAVTAMTPLQYQKQIRLQQARFRLLTAPDDIAGVGQAVGYVSPSQFSREYRRLFGEAPGRDALRLRGTAQDQLAL